jgi:hypothetical protein
MLLHINMKNSNEMYLNAQKVELDLGYNTWVLHCSHISSDS